MWYSPIGEKVYVTQWFGERPEVYGQFGMAGHNGIDYRVKFTDTPAGRRYIYAVADGLVSRTRELDNSGYGREIRLTLDTGQVVNYGHLHSLSVDYNDRVEAGQVIGITNNSGFSSGAHLHFGLLPKNPDYNNGYKGWVNPVPYLENMIDPESGNIIKMNGRQGVVTDESPGSVNNTAVTDANTDPNVYPFKMLDVSHWQGKKRGLTVDWENVPRFDAVVLKATQGQAHVDTDYSDWRQEIQDTRKLGFYHFANGEDFEKEADHFLETVGELKEGQFMALDWEHSWDNFDAPEWCENFLDYIYDKTNTKPILYLGNREVSFYGDDWSDVAAKYDLWVSRYPKTDGTFYEDKDFQPATGPWREWSIWQYSSTGTVEGIDTFVDLNVARSIPAGFISVNGECEENLKKMTSDYENERNKRITSDNRIEKLLLENEACDSEIDKMRKDLSDKNSEISKLKNQVSSLGGEVTDLEEERETIWNKIKTLFAK